MAAATAANAAAIASSRTRGRGVRTGKQLPSTSVNDELRKQNMRIKQMERDMETVSITEINFRPLIA